MIIQLNEFLKLSDEDPRAFPGIPVLIMDGIAFRAKDIVPRQLALAVPVKFTAYAREYTWLSRAASHVVKYELDRPRDKPFTAAQEKWINNFFE